MATQFSWKITNLYTVNAGAQEPNYVVNALWTLTGVDGEYTASIDGNTQFEVNQEQTDFVPFSQLTEAMVIGWVQESLGEQGIANFEANVQGQIDSMKNPPVAPQNTPLPWATPAAK